jgi:hypothetical protein
MPSGVELAADGPFASKEEAVAFLVMALPEAMAANPKYRGDNGAVTQWSIDSVTFGPGATPTGVSLDVKEGILEFRNGVQTATGSHEVRFLIEDVQITELTDSAYRTENGDTALGVMFRCNSGKCIAAKWNGADSPADWTDISIQDAARRAEILSAFQALKRLAGDRAAPKT